MKHLIKLAFLLLALLLPDTATAASFVVDGIYYNILNDNEAAVTYQGCNFNEQNSYSGSIAIPSSVTYNGKTYSVTTIGSDAFINCRGLISVTIPNSVTSIGSSAFSRCSGLTSIDIPNSVTTIGSSAFDDCSSLTSIDIPNTVTTIGSSAFRGTAWYNNQPDGLVYAGLVAYEYKGIMPEGTSISLREGTKTIGNSAFSGRSRLTNIDIPNSVTYIGGRAFYGCSGLISIIIPNSVTYIGEEAFSGCSSLTSIAIPNTVTTIGSSAFRGTAWYNNQPDGLVYAGLVAYEYKGIMPEGTSISLREGTKTIGNSAFSGCSGLTSIDIPNSVTAIGDRAFWDCSGLTSIEIPNYVTTIGHSAFYGCSGLTSIEIPNSVTYIGSSAFYNCSGLTSVIIGNSVTSIGSNTFYNCRDLTSIEIPNSVTTIDSSAFSGTAWYKNQPDGLVYAGLVAYKYKGTMPEGTSITLREGTKTIGHSAFSGCNGLTSITIPNSVETIGERAFYNCSNLTSITIPNTVSSIGNDAFNYCSNLANIIVESGNTTFDSRNNCNAIIETASNTMITGCKNTIIPNTVASIGSCAFLGCSGMTSIIIPNSVTSIGDWAFIDCSSLTSIVIPSSIKNIGIYTFIGCYGLNEVYSFISDPSQIIMDGEVFRLEYPAQITMGSSAFSRYLDSYASRTLYVPAGTLAAYQSDARWSYYFGSILEMGNYLSIPDAEVFHGDTIVVPVKMFNEASVISFQTDIFLPEGLELLQEDGEYIIDPSERMTRTHSIMSDNVSNGSIRVLCYSSNYKPFTGNSGDDLFYLTVKVADDAEGDYTIQLKNTLLTNTDFVDMPAPDVAATVNVKAYILGDANNSRLVTVGDVVATAQYVLEQNPQPFIFEAADVNFDGTITVADVSRIAWMVLNPGAKAPRRAPVLLNSGDRMSGEGISLMPGETRRVSIALDNAMDYSAFQLDLNLPEGLTASNFQLTDRAGSHAFDVNTLGDGNIRALCYSPALTAISGHEGALLTFDVTATSAVTGAITVDGIELVTTACESVRLDGFAIDVNSTSGVNEQVAGKTVARVDYYNLAGQQIDRPEAGVTLIVTTYTDGTRTTAKIVR